LSPSSVSLQISSHDYSAGSLALIKQDLEVSRTQ
jgi:hypothetical protein